MKKYTIIYSERVSKYNNITKFVHIETDNLAVEIEKYDTVFVFDGWCQETID